MVNVNELEELLDNSNLQYIENTIADKLNSNVYKENLPLLIGLMKEEVDTSMLSLNIIKDFIDNHSDDVIDFGLSFLDKSKPESLCIGFAITYAIYIVYLKEKDEKELLQYLKQRGIPKASKLLEKLLYVKEKIDL